MPARRLEGGIEAGLRMGEAAMGGLGTISAVFDRAPEEVAAHGRGALARSRCLPAMGAQYAGWNLSSGNYFAMGSGPARALARVEPLFE